MKNTVILGDSYSTFEGYIPEGYSSYYYDGRTDVGNDVIKVEQTWWWQLFQEKNLKLVLNCSYSGTAICHTGYEGKDWKDISFITRFDRLLNENFFEKNDVDTLIIFGGTNDSWANVPVGELNFDNLESQNMYESLPAILYLTTKVHTLVQKGVKVYFIINGTEIKDVIKNAIKTCCDKFGIKTIEIGDFDKHLGHPTIVGMKQVAEQISKQFQQNLIKNKLKRYRLNATG